VQVVDSQGNIFIPDVGPVKLGGVKNSNVNGTVKAAIARVYTDDVEVYTNLITAQSASVYVTGYVNKPGKYAGMPSRIPDIVLKEGDAIVVKPLMHTVFVGGDAARPNRFEFVSDTITGGDVMALSMSAI